jgi:1-acyl-sn-glycerol-3-phosphate acyltransferase
VVLPLLSVVYWTFFLLTLPIGFVVALVVWLVALPFDRKGRAVHLFTCLWAHFYILCCPIWSSKVTGRELIPKGPSVIIANHESLIDPLVLFGLYRDFKCVSKRSNFKLPIIGWLMRLCRYIPIERGDRASMMRMMEIAHRWLREGTAILILPEGTRSMTGELQAFKKGAFWLAMESGAPVVPVVMTGTGRTLPKHGLILQDRMDATLTVLPPLDPRDFSSVEELRDAARAAIAEGLEREAVVALPT